MLWSSYFLKGCLSLLLFMPAFAQAQSQHYDMLIVASDISSEVSREDSSVRSYNLVNPTITLKKQQGQGATVPPEPKGVEPQDFVALWSAENTKNDSFAKTPPNATLSFTLKGQTCEAQFVITAARYTEEGKLMLTTRALSAAGKSSSALDYKVNGTPVSPETFQNYVNDQGKENIIIMVDSFNIWDILDPRH